MENLIIEKSIKEKKKEQAKKEMAKYTSIVSQAIKIIRKIELEAQKDSQNTIRLEEYKRRCRICLDRISDYKKEIEQLEKEIALIDESIKQEKAKTKEDFIPAVAKKRKLMPQLQPVLADGIDNEKLKRMSLKDTLTYFQMLMDMIINDSKINPSEVQEREIEGKIYKLNKKYESIFLECVEKYKDIQNRLELIEKQKRLDIRFDFIYYNQLPLKEKREYCEDIIEMILEKEATTAIEVTQNDAKIKIDQKYQIPFMLASTSLATLNQQNNLENLEVSPGKLFTNRIIAMLKGKIKTSAVICVSGTISIAALITWLNYYNSNVFNNPKIIEDISTYDESNLILLENTYEIEEENVPTMPAHTRETIEDFYDSEELKNYIRNISREHDIPYKIVKKKVYDKLAEEARMKDIILENGKTRKK